MIEKTHDGFLLLRCYSVQLLSFNSYFLENAHVDFRKEIWVDGVKHQLKNYMIDKSKT